MSSVDDVALNSSIRKRVIQGKITQFSGNPVSDVSEKITLKNTPMCSNDTNQILDADHY